MKSYKITIVVILIGLSLPRVLFAQDSSMNGIWQRPYKENTTAYIEYLSKEYGITIKVPQTFIDLHKYYVVRPVRQDIGFVRLFMYGPIFQTKNKDCIVMYPARPLPLPMTLKVTKSEKQMTKVSKKITLPNPNKLPRHLITRLLKDNTGLYDLYGNPLSDTVHFHFNNHVTIIAGKKPQEMFNADTMYIYDLPLQKPFRGKYPFRTGLVLFKKNRGTMLFMLFFTPQGKKHEQKYINMLAGNVWYDEYFRQSKK